MCIILGTSVLFGIQKKVVYHLDMIFQFYKQLFLQNEPYSETVSNSTPSVLQDYTLLIGYKF